jgi:hypothetical protein
MAKMIFFRGPKPQGRLCAVCAAVAKGHVISASQMQINDALAGTIEDTPLILQVDPRGLPASAEIADAVTQAVVQLPAAGTGQMALMLADVCWSHVNGLVIKEGGLIPASADQMPYERGGVDLAMRAAAQRR